MKGKKIEIEDVDEIMHQANLAIKAIVIPYLSEVLKKKK